MTHQVTQDLLDCPFCGGEPTTYEGTYTSSVKCDNGHAIHVYKPTIAEAVDAWNTRQSHTTEWQKDLADVLEPFADLADEADSYRHQRGSTCEWRISYDDLSRARDIFRLVRE